MSEPLPSIEAPLKPVSCADCGELILIVDPPFCGACEDRRKTERIIESGNDYRRQAQFYVDMAQVRARTRRHVNRG